MRNILITVCVVALTGVLAGRASAVAEGAADTPPAAASSDTTETAAAAAEIINVPAQERAARLAIGVCGTCHGPRGISEQPKYPRLAGQNAHYLAAQLRAFRSQARGDPDAISYMWGMAGNLDDATIDALAAYYAAQPTRAGRRGTPAMLERGAAIFTQGIDSDSVPACSTCHGPDGHGIADFPRLAGQHAQYLLKQIRSFQSGMRDVAVMHGVAQGLKTSDMIAVADFLQAQP